jgi:hypothetical protein
VPQYQVPRALSQAIDGVSLQLVLRAHESHLHVAQPAVSLFGWLSRCMKRAACAAATGRDFHAPNTQER